MEALMSIVSEEAMVSKRCVRWKFVHNLSGARRTVQRASFVVGHLAIHVTQNSELQSQLQREW